MSQDQEWDDFYAQLELANMEDAPEGMKQQACKFKTNAIVGISCLRGEFVFTVHREGRRYDSADSTRPEGRFQTRFSNLLLVEISRGQQQQPYNVRGLHFHHGSRRSVSSHSRQQSTHRVDGQVASKDWR